MLSLRIPNLLFVAAIMALSACSHSKQIHQSVYVGQEKREIKSLSKEDIYELSNGHGWGFAKAAELNGMPGPAHILEMENEIGLTQLQKKKIEHLYQQMKDQAIPLGLDLIEHERKLNDQFADKTITDSALRELLNDIALIRSKLRYVHLSTHLNTPHILSNEQIILYNQLRGYGSNDPCTIIPKGHDPALWKKHNNCK